MSILICWQRILQFLQIIAVASSRRNSPPLPPPRHKVVIGLNECRVALVGAKKRKKDTGEVIDPPLQVREGGTTAIFPRFDEEKTGEEKPAVYEKKKKIKISDESSLSLSLEPRRLVESDKIHLYVHTDTHKRQWMCNSVCVNV